MFDTRLIYLVVEWERRMEIENREQKNHRSEAFEYYPIALGPCRKEPKFKLVRMLKLVRDHNNFPHLPELKADIDGPSCSEA
jgi:hypothetical protein